MWRCSWEAYLDKEEVDHEIAWCSKCHPMVLSSYLDNRKKTTRDFYHAIYPQHKRRADEGIRSDLPLGNGKSIGGDSTLTIQGFQSGQNATLAIATPLLSWLSTTRITIDLAKMANSCKRIKNTSKNTEEHNLKLQI